MVRKQEVTISCLLLSKSIMEVLLRQLAPGDPSPKKMKSPVSQNLIKSPKKVLLQVIDFL